MRNDVGVREVRIKRPTSLGLVGCGHLLQSDVVADSVAKSASAGQECRAGMGGLLRVW